uniref:Uncharacterized protein n=1 Tax=Cannabis sativa TaxID=3483 RepID=A0A803PB03_CANSA
MTHLKSALVLNCKLKSNKELATPSSVNPPQTRKSEAVNPLILDLSKKQQKEKYVSDYFVVQIEGTPIEDLWARYSNYMTQGVIEGLKKVKLKAASKDKKIKDLGRAKDKAGEKIKKLEEQIVSLTRDLNNEKEEKKKAYDQVVNDYIYTTLTKLLDFHFSIFVQRQSRWPTLFAPCLQLRPKA